MPMKVAVVGCGFQGAIHARNVAASPHAELAWCVDVDLGRARALAEDCGASHASDRVADVWQDEAVEAVVIATTTNTHHELALAAARHQKHMLLEKPMAMTVEQCLAIERACDEEGVIAVVGYKFRFTEAVAETRRFVPEPRVLVAHTLYDPAPAGSSSWVNDRSKSGGRLVSSLVHSIDLVRFLTGDEVLRVYAEGALIAEPRLPEPDTAVATLMFREGAIGSIVHGTAGASGLVSTWSFQAASLGVNATIHDHGRKAVLRRAGEQELTVVDPAEDPFEAGTKPLFDGLVAAIEGEDVEMPGPRDGTMSLLVARCIEEAMQAGQPVDVPSL